MYAILFLVLCVAVTECPELFNAERKKKKNVFAHRGKESQDTKKNWCQSKVAL